MSCCAACATGASCSARAPRVGGGNVFEIIADEVLSPRTLLRALSFIGWPVMLTEYLPGFLGPAAEAAIHAAPGVFQGESFSDALVAEYSWRLKLAASYLTGQAVTAASAAAAGVLGQAAGELGGLGLTTEAEAKLKEAIAAARRQLGDKAVDALIHQAEETANRTINQSFERAVRDPALQAYVAAPATNVRDLIGLRREARRLGVREDVLAQAISALKHERVFDLDPSKFSVATGEYIGPIQGRPQEGPVLVPIVVENSGAFSETPAQKRQREEIERALAAEQAPSLFARLAVFGVVAAPVVLVPLALDYLFDRR